MNISNETLERVEYAEAVAFVYFADTNMQHFKQIKKNPDFFGNWDCSGITKNDRKFIVEFKVRNANACDYSGKTLIETYKLKALKVFQEHNPGFTVKYICYFNDYGLSFNLSTRFKQGGNSDILSVYDMPCNRSYYNTGQQYKSVKKVNFLAFNAGMWGDKVIKYDRRELI